MKTATMPLSAEAEAEMRSTKAGQLLEELHGPVTWELVRRETDRGRVRWSTRATWGPRGGASAEVVS